MDSKRILQLLARKMGKAVSEKELVELEELLTKHPKQRFLIEVLQSMEEEKRHIEPAVSENELIREGWKLLQREMTQVETQGTALTDDMVSPQGLAPLKGKRRRNISVIRVYRAAVWMGIIVLCASSFFILKHRKTRQPFMASVQMRQISLPYGAPEKKVLPDSSVVWMNAGSHIRYATGFSQNKREVYLQGEAYFEVKHDATHPFIVHAGNIDIKVLGTEFNVQAYADENKIETTLINGRIQVQIAGNPDKKIILTPHEKLTVINREFTLTGTNKSKSKELSFQVKEMPPVAVGTQVPELAWMEDKLAFQDVPLGELAKKLDRRFNVYIQFNDTQLEKERLTGVFVNENIQKAMKILQMTTPFLYKIKGDSVFLSK